MIHRAVFLSVGGVEGVGQCKVFPAGVILCLAYRCASLRCDYIHHNIASAIRRQVEGHVIIHLTLGEPNVDGPVEIAVDEHIYLRVIVGLLHGEE